MLWPKNQTPRSFLGSLPAKSSFCPFYKGKMAQNWPKMSKFQNPLNTHPKMVNACNKCQTYHFGGCFAGFPESVLRFRHSKSHFLSLEKGHFRQKCPLLGTKKWDFERPNLRTDSGNPAKHPPKWWGRHLFHVFTIFGRVLSKFSNLLILGQFRAIFPL